MKTEKMHAIVFYSPENIKYEEVDVPTLGPCDLLIETKTVLTCGTDLKMYKRGHPLVKPPIIFGHEVSGIVTEVGERVNKFREGDRVMLANSAPCNECFYCKKEQESLCENVNRALIGFSTQGAYAEYVRIPERIAKINTYAFPSRISFEDAAFLEPLSCVVHGNELAGIKNGDTVAILGSGVIGLLHAKIAKLYEKCQVIISDPHEEKLEIARKIGVDETINMREVNQINRIRELTDNRGADVVIEAVGKPEAWQHAYQMVRKGGTVLFFGGCSSGTTMNFDIEKLHYGELTIKGAFHHNPRAVRKAKDIISAYSLLDKLNLSLLISEKMKLKDTELALQKMATGRALKIALYPE
jgi:L-iditol 2-dehydrogenase